LQALDGRNSEVWVRIAANRLRSGDEEAALRAMQWAYACLAYGELLELQGKTDIGHSFALALQKIALESLGDTEKLAAVAARQDAHRSGRQETLRSRSEFSEILLFANPAVFYDYLAEMRKLGEFSARIWLHTEAERWLSQHGEPDCRS
jgi:hypothetical protein